MHISALRAVKQLAVHRVHRVQMAQGESCTARDNKMRPLPFNHHGSILMRVQRLRSCNRRRARILPRVTGISNDRQGSLSGSTVSPPVGIRPRWW